MDDHRHESHAPDTAPAASGLPFDEALNRLEDVLLAYPYDRALPDLGTILADARVSQELLRHDDRAIKVLHEAILARPLGSHDAVARVKTEVELLTLEVRVLTERLRRGDAAADEAERAGTRLARVRRRLDEIRREL